MYGNFHRETREEYVAEIESGVRSDTRRLWIVFSHIYQDEDQKIVNDLGRDWDVRRVTVAPGPALVLASRRPVLAEAQRPHSSGGRRQSTAAVSAAAIRTSNRFWEWGMRTWEWSSRNSRRPRP
jgi:hypothetical protein